MLPHQLQTTHNFPHYFGSQMVVKYYIYVKNDRQTRTHIRYNSWLLGGRTFKTHYVGVVEKIRMLSM